MRLLLLGLLGLASSGALAQTLGSLSFLPDEAADGTSATCPALPCVEIFADGGVRSGVTGSADNGASTGSLGIQFGTEFGGHLLSSAFTISVVGTAQDVTSEYGSALLAPASGSTLNAGLVEARWSEVISVFDFRAYTSVSTSNWSIPLDADGLFDQGGAPETFSVGVLGAGLLVGKTLVNGTVANTRVAVVADLGLSLRNLIGDLSSDGNDSLRTSFFGTTGTVFGGLEASLGLQVNGVKAALTFYQYAEHGSGGIGGFTDGQVVAGIGIQAPIVSGTLTPSPSVPAASAQD